MATPIVKRSSVNGSIAPSGGTIYVQLYSQKLEYPGNVVYHSGYVYLSGKSILIGISLSTSVVLSEVIVETINGVTYNKVLHLVGNTCWMTDLSKYVPTDPKSIARYFVNVDIKVYEDINKKYYISIKLPDGVNSNIDRWKNMASELPQLIPLSLTSGVAISP